MYSLLLRFFFFFFNDTATTEIYTLSLHDALPIWFAEILLQQFLVRHIVRHLAQAVHVVKELDRKSTRLNSSHLGISYAVFCLKKKKSGIVQKSNWGTCTFINIDQYFILKLIFLCK